MALAVVGSIGTPGTSAGSGTTVSMTTGTAVASGERAIFGVGWYGGAGASLNIGGTVDNAANRAADTNYRHAIISVAGPISSGTTVTATVPSGSFSRSICGLIAQGVATSSYVDTSADGDGTDGNWEATLTPTGAGNVLIVCGGWVDFSNEAFTPLSTYTEVADFSNVGDNNQIGLVYRIVNTPSGSYTPGATSSSGNSNVAAAVAYLEGAGSTDATVTAVVSDAAADAPSGVLSAGSTIAGVVSDGAADAPAAAVTAGNAPVREFDGSDDILTVDNGAIFAMANGAYSLAMVVKPASLGAGGCFMACWSTGPVLLAGIYDAGGGEISLKDADETVTTSGLGLTAGEWQLVVVTKAAGTTTPRAHRSVIGSGSTTHVNFGGTFTGVSSALVRVDFGAFQGADFKAMRLATAAIDLTEWSDANVESIDNATNDINALGPNALWDFTQASTATPVDDISASNSADQTAITGTTVITTDSPPNWAFGVGTDATVTAVVCVAAADAPVGVMSAGVAVAGVPAVALGQAPPANQMISSVVNAPAVVASADAPAGTVGEGGDRTVAAVPAAAAADAPVGVVAADVTVAGVVSDAAGDAPAGVITSTASVGGVPAAAIADAPRPGITPEPEGESGGMVAVTFSEGTS